MSGEQSSFDDVGLTAADLAAALDDLPGGHAPDDDLWVLATLPANRLSEQQRTFLMDHVLQCRNCDRRFAAFRAAWASPVEIPPLPASLLERVKAGLKQASSAVIFIAMLARGVVRVTQRVPAARFRGMNPAHMPQPLSRGMQDVFPAGTNTVEIPAGKPLEIPEMIGDLAVLLVFTPAESLAREYLVRVKLEEEEAFPRFASVECVLSLIDGTDLEAAKFQGDGFTFTQPAAIGERSYYLTLRERDSVKPLGFVQIVAQTAHG